MFTLLVNLTVWSGSGASVSLCVLPSSCPPPSAGVFPHTVPYSAVSLATFLSTDHQPEGVVSDSCDVIAVSCDLCAGIVWVQYGRAATPSERAGEQRDTTVSRGTKSQKEEEDKS